MNESQYIRQRRDENDSEADRREEADEKAIDAFIAEFRRLLHFVLDPFDTDSHHDEDAGRKGRDRHHDGIRQEIKEGKNVHAKDGEGCKRTESERRERAQDDHQDEDRKGREITAPAAFILKGGDAGFCQRNRRGKSRKKDKCEEDDTHEGTKPHAGKDLRDGDEHERRACIQHRRIAAGEGKDRRDDHKAGEDRNP